MSTESTESEWNSKQEIYLGKLHQQSLEEYNYFNKNFLYYFETSKYYNIPVLILSALNSIISMALVSFIQQDYVSIISSSVSLLVGIITSIQMFLKINENMTNSLVISIKFHKLSVKISKELSIKRGDRKTDGNNFLNEVYNEYQDCIDRCGAYQRKIKNFLLLDGEIDMELSYQSSTPRSQNGIALEII